MLTRRVWSWEYSMHQVLLIDEILQQVLELCSECGLDTLSQVARCCKAWKDPALDKLWRRLSSVTQLLQLVPGLVCIGGIYVSARLNHLFLDYLD